MANDGTQLGDRMKAYEAAAGSVLPRYLPFVIRVDVRAAHSLLRTANKPFDMQFVGHMQAAMMHLCREVQGAVFAYQQSDEISVLACAYKDHTQQSWFGGRVQKIASVAAGLASSSLSLHRHLAELPASLAFDGRVFALPNAVEVANYFVWRQRDAQRNAVAMAAQAHFSVRQLYNKNRVQMIEMLREVGVMFDEYPINVRNGSLCWLSPAGGWVASGASNMDAQPDGWLARNIPPLPSFDDGGSSRPTVHAAVEEYFPSEVPHDLGRSELFHG